MASRDLYQSVKIEVLDNSAGSVCGQAGLAIGVSSWQEHRLYSEVRRLPLAGLHSRMGLFYGHSQVGLLGGLPDWAGMLAVLCIQVGPLSGLCNHLWSGEVASCVP